MYPENEEETNKLVQKFESMLETDKVFFFDLDEIVMICTHYLNNGSTDLAKKALEIGIELYPTSPDLLVVQVEYLIIQNKLREAEQLLGKLQEMPEQSELVPYLLSNFFRKVQNLSKAIKVLEVALPSMSEKAEAYKQLAELYLMSDKQDKSLEYTILYAKEKNFDKQSTILLSESYQASDRDEDAMEILQKFIDSDPYNHEIWYAIGKLYYKQKKYHDALNAFEYTTYANETYFHAYIERGKTLEKLGRLQEALELYTIANSQIDPDPYLFSRLAKCYLKLGDKKQAFKYFKRTVEEDPLLPECWYQLSKIYFKKGKLKKALHASDKAFGLDENNLKILHLSAKILLKMDRIDEFDEVQEIIKNVGKETSHDLIYHIDNHIKEGEYEFANMYLNSLLGFPGLEYKGSYSLSILLAKMAGCYYMLKDYKQYMLKMELAIQYDTNAMSLVEEFFPKLWADSSFQDYIKNIKE